MAQLSFPTYQIVLISIVGFNVCFWILLFCWRQVVFSSSSHGDRCRRFFGNLFSLPSEVGEISSFGVTSAVMRINSDFPPPYEQAIKYPSITPISGRVENCAPCLVRPTSHFSPCPERYEEVTNQLNAQQSTSYKNSGPKRSSSFSDVEALKKVHKFSSPV